MATVIYLPKLAGTGTGDGSGVIRDKLKREAAAEADRIKGEKLAELFGNITKDDSPERTMAIQENIKGGAITEEGSLLSLVSQMRSNEDANNIKIDAFDPKGNKVPFSLSKQALATGTGEKNANSLGLTLTNKGKQVDFFEDSVSQKFAGVGSAGNRPTGKITLDEWKSKYGQHKTPTDTDTAIGDYIRSKKDDKGNVLQSTSITRKRAREFLYNRKQGIEVINSAFGKKTGNDWTIDDPLKNQMAIIAKMQVEKFIMEDGLSAEQAGGKAVELVKDMFKDQIDANNNPVVIPEEKGGFIETISNMFKSDETKSAEEVRKSANYIGDLNEIPIEVPDNITSPAKALEYIMQTYKVSKEDARAFLLDNQPTE